jgi:WD40 repeat protein
VREEDKAPTRRVEIIHESLLANWPRLVRWQTQDADAAQLRDQLRQAARTWDEQGRSDDTLWTGSAYLEFAVWRERYPGGLTGTEEAFASAMASLAGRRRRRRRMAVAAVLLIASAVTVVTTALWRRSVFQERRAEAQKLIALGQLEVEGYPTAALAHAMQSLELVDSKEARLLALEALWEGPTAFVVNELPSIDSAFSATGEWLVQGHDGSSSMSIISRDGSQLVVDQPSKTGATRTSGYFQGHRNLFISFGAATDAGRIALWSASEGRLLATTIPVEEPQVYSENQTSIVVDDGRPRALFAIGKGDLVSVDALYVDGEYKHIGQVRLKVPIPEGSRLCMPRSSPWLALVDGREVSVVEIGENGLSDRRPLGTRAEGDLVSGCRVDPLERFFLTSLQSGKIEMWDPSGKRPQTSFDGPPGGWVSFSADGSHLIGTAPSPGEEDLWDTWIWSIENTTFRLQRRINGIRNPAGPFDPVGPQYAVRGPLPDNRLWPLRAPSSAEPILLRRGPAGYVQSVNFSPDGRWLATNHSTGLAMWPLVGPLPSVKRLDLRFWVGGLAFGPAGKFLATAADDTVTLIPLEGTIPAAEHTVFKAGDGLLHCLAVSPDGSRFAGGDDPGDIWIGRDDGSIPTRLGDSEERGWGTIRAAFSPDGRLLAFLTGVYDLSSAVFRVWNLESNQEVATLSLPGEEVRFGSAFADDGRLLTATTAGVVAWDVESGEHQILAEVRAVNFAASSNGRRLVVIEEGEGGLGQDPAGSPVFFDLDTGESRTLATHGLQVWAMALDRDGTVVVTGDRNGVIRVGPVTGEEPHLLLGHEGEIRLLAFDPLGRWIASAGDDDTVRLWPMPDLSKPPLHTLPREELIAKLKTLTNLRVVRDPESPTGWKLTHDPFPGWETVPTW